MNYNKCPIHKYKYRPSTLSLEHNHTYTHRVMSLTESNVICIQFKSTLARPKININFNFFRLSVTPFGAQRNR